jgi:hypothetical protein
MMVVAVLDMIQSPPAAVGRRTLRRWSDVGGPLAWPLDRFDNDRGEPLIALAGIDGE